MSILEYIFDVRNNILEYWQHYLKLSYVDAAIKRETVPCIRPDGSYSTKEVCVDDDGNRVPCPTVEACDSEGGCDCNGGCNSKRPLGASSDSDFSEDGVSKRSMCRGLLAFFRCPYGSDVMATPYYADLGKKANDVFSKGYHFGVFKLDLKTKSESGVQFTSGIVSNQESGKVFGSLSSKYSIADYGLSFTEKWNTDNTLATDITIQDKIAAGLKITLEGTFAPQTGSKTGKLKTSFTNERVALNTNMDLDMAGPIVDVAAVLGHQGWFAGVHSQFDSQKAKLTKNNFGLGYQTKDFALHTNVDNGKEFGGSIYQKVKENLECGISMKWAAGSSDTLFGVGFAYTLDRDASLHAKLNNKALIGLGYRQVLRPGVTLTLSAAVDGQNFNAGGHKVGLALELEP